MRIYNVNLHGIIQFTNKYVRVVFFTVSNIHVQTQCTMTSKISEGIIYAYEQYPCSLLYTIVIVYMF